MNADAERLKQHVVKLAEELGPRDISHPDNLDLVADYIHDQFEQFSDDTSEQTYEADGMQLRNISSLFGPDTSERIVIGAHYDVAGPYPGADDNASGVAGVLELARLLPEEKLPLKVELVSWPLEEPPYFYSRKMGSFVHAKLLKDQEIRVRAMIALEMIGYFTDEPGSQSYPLSLLRPFYPSVGNYIAVVGKLFQKSLVRKIKEAIKSGSPLPVESLNAPRIVPGVGLSDHINYWWAGYPAVMITDTAMYRNPNYHSPFDTPDTLDYQRMGQVVDGVKNAILKLSEPSN